GRQGRGDHRRTRRDQVRRQVGGVGAMTLPGGVVVASNRAADGIYADETGPVIADFLRRLGFVVPDPVVVHDGEPVADALRSAVASGARVVLTTGGTGLTPTDR